jgi:hypothetical protein
MVLATGRLWSQSGGCIEFLTSLSEGEPAEVTVEGPTWLGLDVETENVYRIDAAGPDGTALQVWMTGTDSGSNCRYTSGDPIAEAVTSGGAVTLDWSADSWGDAVLVTPPNSGVPTQMTLRFETLAVAPGVGQVDVLPVVTHAPGKLGTFFRSDVTIYNRGAALRPVQITLFPEDGSAPLDSVITMNPGQVVTIADVVGTMFDRDTSGILWLDDYWTESAAVSSRTYTVTDGGSRGQFVGPINWHAAAHDSSRAHDDGRRFLLHLSSNNDFRTNVGLSEVMGLDTTVDLVLRDERGEVVASGSVDVPAYGHVQLNDVFSFLGAGPRDHASLETAVHGLARLVSYASVVDNRSGDAILVPGQTLESATNELYFPAAASGDGTRGTHWQTDVRILPTTRLQVLQLVFMPSDGGPEVPLDLDVDVPASGILAIDDIVAEIGGSGSGALALYGSGSGTLTRMLATSRTYTTSDHGTLGQFIPAVTRSGGAHVGAILPVSSSEDYRTNIGIFNGRYGDTDRVIVRLISPNGALRGSAEWPNVRGHIQLNDIFRVLAALPGEGCVVEVETLERWSYMTAYGSVVDNHSGDAVYVPAVEVNPYYGYPYEPSFRFELSNHDNAVLLDELAGAVGTDRLPPGSFSAAVTGVGTATGGDLPVHVMCLYRGTDGLLKSAATPVGGAFDGIRGDDHFWCVIPEWSPPETSTEGATITLTDGAQEVAFALEPHANGLRLDRTNEAVIAVHPYSEAYRADVTGDLGRPDLPTQLAVMVRDATSGDVRAQTLTNGDLVQDIDVDDRLAYVVLDWLSRADNTGTAALTPTCATRAAACGGGASGNLFTTDCLQSLPGHFGYGEKVTFAGQTGQTVTIHGTWIGAIAGMLLQNPDGQTLAFDNDHGTWDTGELVDIALTVDGTYTLWVGAYYFGNPPRPVPYHVDIECAGP